jgi:beta-glucosidase
MTAGELIARFGEQHVAAFILVLARVASACTRRSASFQVGRSPDSAVRREQLTRLAASGMTVLTNAGALPLTRPGRVALIGRHALDTVEGSPHVRARPCAVSRPRCAASRAPP